MEIPQKIVMRSLDTAEHDVKSDDVDNLVPTFL